jgi:hypothetical protein
MNDGELYTEKFFETKVVIKQLNGNDATLVAVVQMKPEPEVELGQNSFDKFWQKIYLANVFAKMTKISLPHVVQMWAEKQKCFAYDNSDN